MKTFCFALLFLNSLELALATTVESHCLDNEIVYFSCRIDRSTKVLSLCGGIHDRKPSWLQYRFGAIGNLELIFPKTTNDSMQKFAGFFEYHKAIPFEIQEVWFRIGKYHYKIESVFSGLPDGDPPCSKEKSCIDNTLSVDDGQRWTNLRCSAEVKNSLRRLEGHISDDQTDR